MKKDTENYSTLFVPAETKSIKVKQEKPEKTLFEGLLKSIRSQSEESWKIDYREMGSGGFVMCTNYTCNYKNLDIIIEEERSDYGGYWNMGDSNDKYRYTVEVFDDGESIKKYGYAEMGSTIRLEDVCPQEINEKSNDIESYVQGRLKKAYKNLDSKMTRYHKRLEKERIDEELRQKKLKAEKELKLKEEKQKNVEKKLKDAFL